MNTISFPNMFDINNSVTSTNLSYTYKSIHESLTSLLLTNPGELLGDPAYGCGLRRHIFDIKSDLNLNELKNTIVSAINKYLPYIQVSHGDIQIFDNANNDKYKLVIYYSDSSSSASRVFELIF